MALDIAAIAHKARTRIQEALRDSNLPVLLANYDNKGLIALAAACLKRSRLSDFESWLVRVLRNNKMPVLAAAIRDSLPTIQAR